MLGSLLGEDLNNQVDDTFVGYGIQVSWMYDISVEVIILYGEMQFLEAKCGGS